jgi:hypothetical protein
MHFAQWLVVVLAPAFVAAAFKMFLPLPTFWLNSYDICIFLGAIAVLLGWQVALRSRTMGNQVLGGLLVGLPFLAYAWLPVFVWIDQPISGHHVVFVLILAALLVAFQSLSNAHGLAKRTGPASSSDVLVVVYDLRRRARMRSIYGGFSLALIIASLLGGAMLFYYAGALVDDGGTDLDPHGRVAELRQEWIDRGSRDGFPMSTHRTIDPSDPADKLVAKWNKYEIARTALSPSDRDALDASWCEFGICDAVDSNVVAAPISSSNRAMVEALIGELSREEAIPTYDTHETWDIAGDEPATYLAIGELALVRAVAAVQRIRLGELPGLIQGAETAALELVVQRHGVTETLSRNRLISTSLFRAGIVVLIILLVQILSALHRYSSRVAAYYSSRADVLLLALSDSTRATNLATHISDFAEALGPPPVEFGKDISPDQSALQSLLSGIKGTLPSKRESVTHGDTAGS